MNALMRMFRCYRVPEAFLVSGFIFIGAFFAAPDSSSLIGLRPLLFLPAACLLMVAVYAFNSWAGLREDAANPRLDGASSPVARYRTAVVAALCAAAVLFLFSAPRSLPYGAAVFLLSALYSFPRRGMKYVPVAGTLTHLAGGAAQFLCGWSLFESPDPRAAAVALCFGLALAAGHVNHELIDRAADREAGVRSGAVVFGAQAWMLFHLLLTIVTLGLFALLATTRSLPAAQIAPFAAAASVQALSASRRYARPPEQEGFLRHRLIYRVSYAAAGAAFLAVRFIAPMLP